MLGHFQLQYPAPRGPFVEPNEVNFCDSYPNVASSRTPYPLGLAPLELNSEHQIAEIAILISFVQNPTTFADFNTTFPNGTVNQFLVPFFDISGEGLHCVNVNIESLGLPNVTDGTNATIQVEFNGGDGTLFQCADVTLSSAVSYNSTACSGSTVATATSAPLAPPHSDDDDDSSSGSKSASATSSSPPTSSTSGKPNSGQRSSGFGPSALSIGSLFTVVFGFTSQFA